MSTDSDQRVQATSERTPTARAFNVIEWIVQNPGSTFGTLSQELGLPKASTYRVVRELEDLGWVRTTPGLRNRRLQIGPALTALALNVIKERANWTGVNSLLRKLATTIGETCTIAVQDADNVVFLASMQPDKLLTFVYPAQTTSPLFCSSSGRIFMAEMTDMRLEQYLQSGNREKFTPATVIDKEELLDIVGTVQRTGYAATNSQWVSHVVGAAVPVRDSTGRCIAALSFTATDTRISFERIHEFIPILNLAAIELGRELETIDQ